MMVAVDGVLRGKLPLILDKVSPGLHRVEVGVGRQDGQIRNFKVEVRPGQTYRLHAAMPPQKGGNLNEALFALDSGETLSRRGPPEKRRRPPPPSRK